MTLISNPLLLRKKATDSAYQIEKGLRFNDDDTAYLSRTPSANGNKRKWTFSVWVKRNPGTDQRIFGSSQASHLRFASDDTLTLDVQANGTETGMGQRQTSRKFRDPAAWLHICIVFDSSNATGDDRQILYINGKRETSLGNDQDPTQYLESTFSETSLHTIGYRTSSNGGAWGPYDGYMADPIFIDGLALPPSSFGQFDSARNWNPAEFKLLGRNNGSTWSGMVSGTEDPGWGKTQAFDTNLSNSARAETGNTLTFTPTTKMKRVASLRLYAKHRYGGAFESTLLVNGTNYTSLLPENEAAWIDIPENNLTTIAWSSVTASSGGDAVDIYSIEVDGEILEDGKVSHPNGVARNNPNNGTTWSNSTSGGSVNGSYPMTQSFNGSTSNTGVRAVSGGGFVFQPSSAISYNSQIEVHSGTSGVGTQQCEINDGTAVDVAENKWVTVKTGSGTLTKLEMTAGSTGNGNIYLGGVRIDGHVLIDSSVDNSFHLKFNNTSDIGEDSLNSNDFTAHNLIATSSTSIYSTGLTGSSGSGLTNPAWYAFDGLADNNMAYDGNGGGATLAWTNPLGNGVTALGSGLRIFPRATNGGSRTFTLNGSETTTLAANGWTTISVGSETYLNSFTITGGEAYLSAVEVNGSILVDSDLTDVFNDTPTNFESSGTAHGNYCTLNPLAKGSNLTLSQGNLNITGTNGSLAVCLGTMAVSSGKWYYEFTFNNSSKLSFIAGISNRTTTDDLADWQEPGDYSWNGNGNTWHDIYANGVAQTDFSGSGPTAAGDVIGVLLDFTNTTITIKLNNSTKGTLTTSLPAGLYFPLIGNGSGAAELDATINFGQRAFKYPQSGFNGWCTQNLGDFDEDNNPRKYFDILKWTGTGDNDNYQRGLAFQPDLVWIKGRSATTEGTIVDAARGATKSLNHAYNTAEYTASAPSHEVQAFLSDGVKTGKNGRVGTDNTTYVGWFWDAGTAAITPSDSYDITPSAQWANTTAGFSITKYTGNGSESELPHALGAKPDFIITKVLGTTNDWFVYHIGNNDATGRLQLNTTAQNNPSSNYWNNTPPTNTIVNLNVHNGVNQSSQDFIMYAWTSIPGFSSFGRYTGGTAANNQSFVHTGFKPRFVIIKGISLTDGSIGWHLYDSERHPGNPIDIGLNANNDNAEYSGTARIDFLSNGFKIRAPDNQYEPNQNETYIYCAWADQPFKTSRAN